MSEPVQTPSKTGGLRAEAGVVAAVLSLLASMKFALTVVAMIAIACIAGTLIPQGAQQVAASLERHPDARRGLELLSAIGLTQVFYTWWFVCLLFVFAASLSACTARRYIMIRRTTGAVRARVIGSFITHIGLLLVLAGGAVRVLWGQKGVIQLHEGEIATQAESSEGPIVLPFSVRLSKFTLELHEKNAATSGADKLLVQWRDKKLLAEFPVDLNVDHSVRPADLPAGAATPFTVRVLRYVPDFAIDGSSSEVTSRSAEPNNPALFVSATGSGITNTQWVFARFPDFSNHGGGSDAANSIPLEFRFESAQATQDAMSGRGAIKAFKSTLEVLEAGAVVITRTIMVNSPFSYRGYNFYQLNYDPDDLRWSALQVVKDPGVPIVYGGFVMMMLGLTVVFCIGPWLDPQREQRK